MDEHGGRRHDVNPLIKDSDMTASTANITQEYGPFFGNDAVHGVSFSGKDVWFAGSNGLNRMDPDTGTVTQHVAVPAHAGTAFDGTHLYQLSDTLIQKIDPATGAVLSTIPAPGKGNDSGMAWAEGSLWIGQYRDCTIYQVDPATGEVLRTIQSDRFVTGVTWGGEELWHGTWQDEQSDLRQIDPATGAVLQRLDMPPGTGISGLESDGADRFFCGGGGSGKVRVVKRP